MLEIFIFLQKEVSLEQKRKIGIQSLPMPSLLMVSKSQLFGEEVGGWCYTCPMPLQDIMHLMTFKLKCLSATTKIAIDKIALWFYSSLAVYHLTDAAIQ